jgi:hypothetical protein
MRAGIVLTKKILSDSINNKNKFTFFFPEYSFSVGNVVSGFLWEKEPD